MLSGVVPPSEEDGCSSLLPSGGGVLPSGGRHRLIRLTPVWPAGGRHLWPPQHWLSSVQKMSPGWGTGMHAESRKRPTNRGSAALWSFRRLEERFRFDLVIESFTRLRASQARPWSCCKESNRNGRLGVGSQVNLSQAGLRRQVSVWRGSGGPKRAPGGFAICCNMAHIKSGEQRQSRRVVC